MTVAFALLLALPGCGAGIGPGPGEGEAVLSVTRDFGRSTVSGPAQFDLRSSDTVMRVLDRTAEVEASYGGRFVDAIDGIETKSSPRSLDWFYFVNGVAAEVGAAEYELEDGDTVWWDYRDWSAAMDVPAVTGSYPAPLASEGEPVAVECSVPESLCRLAERRLADDGIEVGRETGPDVEGETRVEVGTLEEIGSDGSLAFGPGAEPGESGVFVRYAGRPGDGTILEVLDETGASVGRLGPGTGLVAATRDSGGSTVWMVTGTDEAGVEAATGLLDPGLLASTYAVVAGPDGRTAIPVPLAAGEEGVGS